MVQWLILLALVLIFGVLCFIATLIYEQTLIVKQAVDRLYETLWRGLDRIGDNTDKVKWFFTRVEWGRVSSLHVDKE